jgi:hypothetical protein
VGNKGQGKKLFTSDKQPAKRGKAGRPKNVFGPLAKECNLTNDDVKKICKNLLMCHPENLSSIVTKYPTVFTVTMANMITQDMKGELTGKYEMVTRTLPKLDGKGKPVFENGNIVMETRQERIPERKRSSETVRYMIERCFGKSIQTDIILTNITEEAEMRILQVFSEAYNESEKLEPKYIDAQIEYVETDSDEQ